MRGRGLHGLAGAGRAARAGLRGLRGLACAGWGRAARAGAGPRGLVALVGPAGPDSAANLGGSNLLINVSGPLRAWHDTKGPQALINREPWPGLRALKAGSPVSGASGTPVGYVREVVGCIGEPGRR